MSSDDDQHGSISVPAKKRHVQRACDMCRRKKSDGLRMSEKQCTNCIENGLPCTFAGAVTKRRSYVEALEARLELTEKIMLKERLQLYALNSAGPSPGSQWSSDSPVVTASRSSGPRVMVAALNIRSMNTPAAAPTLSINQVRDRFQGKSSGAMLVKAAVQLREGYEERDMPWSSRRMHYWVYNPVKHRIPHVGPFVFPDPDLLRALIDLYFIHRNLYFPVLHRPTFERAVADELHTRDAAFGAAVLLVCATGARFSDDAHVFFNQLPFCLDHLFETPTLHELQYYCLASSFLEYSSPATCWTQSGSASDWHRMSVLVSSDRMLSMSLGRIDADLPMECDVEFLENEDPVLAFVQPAGKPSLVMFFNCYLRLNNILAFGFKMLYSLTKMKTLLSYRDHAWEEHLVPEIDSGLTGWIDSIPPHLRWDPNRRDEAFFDQSVFLFCTYYQVQTTIHRSFIPKIMTGGGRRLPSLAICTNAARSCSHVADMSRLRKNGVPVPVLISSVFTSGVVLLLNIWSGKRTEVPPHMNSAIKEVHKCMASMRVCETKWQTAGLLYDILHELATIGQVPLPKDAPAPAPAPPNTHTNKRAREEDPAAQYPRTPAPRVHYPLQTNHPSSHPNSYQSYPAPAPTINTPHPKAAHPFGPLPTYTALSVFHQRAAHPQVEGSTSSWYPSQSASPSGHPEFAASTAVAPDGGAHGVHPNVFTVESFFAAETGYANADESSLDSDMMAMWANAPTNFEMGDWGAYLNVMSELNQRFQAVPQL
ncbi:hypothetical protein DFH08DRAFT_865945 [Mycena albidolilacea]|uniref:Zn(2)-C6 fungal-type domain-containing protein n=1 Tax=Mycena albidolilacea TaxID=1033008 RepID=A0AAD7ET28_9AGAR|nr:hypothetical protein DFH08DRAFT_865945 [Mycena albidolilacea]